MPDNKAVLNDQQKAIESRAMRGLFPLILAGLVVLLVLSNVVAVKLIAVGPLTVDGGVFLFPLVYILGDVLAEVYGFKAARRAIFAGFAASLLATVTIIAVQFSPPSPEWPNQEAFESVLGFVPRIVLASMLAYIAGQLTNAWLMVKLRDRASKSRGVLGTLWFRLIGSTMLGQLVDTLVFCTVAFYGMLLGLDFWLYVALGYFIKVMAEVILLPITTKTIAFVRRKEESFLEYKVNK